MARIGRANYRYGNEHGYGLDRIEAAEDKRAGKSILSILARLYNAIIGARQRHAQRKIAPYLANHAPLSDRTEREIMHHLSGSPWRW